MLTNDRLEEWIGIIESFISKKYSFPSGANEEILSALRELLALRKEVKEWREDAERLYKTPHSGIAWIGNKRLHEDLVKKYPEGK